ncbi:MAG: flavodoxin family protein [Planctomycetota bacterium]
MAREALGIIGSPRSASVSSRLLQAGLDALAAAGWTVSTFDAPHADIAACPACGACAKTGRCVRRDPMGALLEKLLAVDAVLVASPIYFYGLPAQLKTIIDRSQPIWQRRWRLGEDVLADRQARPCLAFLVAGGPETEKLWTGAELTLGVWANTLGLERPAAFRRAETDGADEATLVRWADEAAAFTRDRLASD